MDDKARELFERSDFLLARSKQITLEADAACQRLLSIQSRCTPTKELLLEAETLTKRLRLAFHRLP